MIMGGIGVGKSTLIEALQKCKSQKNEDNQRPNTRSTVSSFSAITKQGDFSVTTFDIAGHASGLCDAKSYARDAHCILLCYSIASEQSFEEIKNWLDAVEEDKMNHDIPIILLGTKQDLELSQRHVQMNQGKLAKTRIGQRCKHFQEISAFHHDKTKGRSALKRLLLKQIFPTAMEYAAQRRPRPTSTQSEYSLPRGSMPDQRTLRNNSFSAPQILESTETAGSDNEILLRSHGH